MIEGASRRRRQATETAEAPGAGTATPLDDALRRLTDFTAPAERPLPPGYYVDNFALVLTTVVERYRDLLAGEELAFHDGFAALSQGAQRLYVRLISRRGPCFRRDRLAYTEIPELDAAVAELTAAGFVDAAEDVPPAALLPLLLRAELLELARELLGTAPVAARKPEAMALLAEQVPPAELARALAARLAVVRPLRREAVDTFRLLFFGNLSQDWTEFVLRDLGVVRYEPYPLRADLRLFARRRELDHALLLRRYRDLVEELLAAGALAAARALAAEVLARSAEWEPAARRFADRICSRVAHALERGGELDDALAFYAGAERPPARERRARVLARLERLDEALRLCAEIAAAPRDETERAFAPGFAHRLRRRRGDTVETPRRPHRPRAEMTLRRRDGAAVEELALAAFAAQGRPGFFSENWLWKSLFGLAFWDVVFAPVAGAFQHPFQFGPLDLHTPDFRAARAEAVERRLAELRTDPAPGPRLLAVYEAKRDTANQLVAWHPELRPALELALARLDGARLAAVCDRLSRDVGRFRRGFPDLFVLDEAGGFELFEVKAPGDQLRPEQGSWIDYLNAHGVRSTILQVRWE